MKTARSSLRNSGLFTLLLSLLAFQAVPIQGQVTHQQIINGLVDYYPLDTVLAGNTTPDLISRRDMVVVNMTSNNIVPANHAGIDSSSKCFNFTQSGSPTVIYYATTGQNPFDGSGDFLPFINQRGATMNFWVIAANNLSGSEQRVMGECAQDGNNNPFFSISSLEKAAIGTNASFLLRDVAVATDPNGVSCYPMSDGTYEDPVINYLWYQGYNDTTNAVFDNTWHMLTMEIGTNGDMHVYVDGKYDQGDQLGIGAPWTDNEGNLTVAPPMPMTNSYYNTNIYPNLTLLPAGTNTAGQYVRWVMPDLCNSGVTTFGGYVRNGSINGGVVSQMSDIAFWNRVLSPAEIAFVMTNGVGICEGEYYCSSCQPWPISFSANPSTIHPGESVMLQWHIQAATTKPIISLLLDPAIGEVTNVTDLITGNGSTNLPVSTSTAFSLGLTYRNSCGYPEQYGGSVFTTVTVIPLIFSSMSYLPSDSNNADNPSFSLVWNSVSNHTYTVQRKLNLSDPTWTTLTNDLPSGGGSTSFTDYMLGSGSTAFYRVTCP
jgi:hypothetical protein